MVRLGTQQCFPGFYLPGTVRISLTEPLSRGDVTQAGRGEPLSRPYRTCAGLAQRDLLTFFTFFTFHVYTAMM